MKISCTQENLLKGLQTVAHIAQTKSSALPVLNHVLIKTEDKLIKLATTNLELGITCLIRGKIEKEGAYTVPAKLLTDYISLLPNERLILEVTDNVLTIESENAHTRIKGIPAEEFPLIPQIEEKEVYQIKGSDFKKALGYVIFAVAPDETRPEISGVLFSFQNKEATLVATDSYRLAEKKLKLEKGEGKKEVIVPARTLQELVRILKDDDLLEICLSPNQILFRFDEVNFISRLIEGQYPDYKQIIPREFKTQLEVEREDFIKVIKTAALFCRTGINDIALELDRATHKLTVSAANAVVGESEMTLSAKITGETNKIVFNFRYLLEGLNTLTSPKVTLEIIDSVNPGILRSKDEKDYLYIIMPIKQ